MQQLSFLWIKLLCLAPNFSGAPTSQWVSVQQGQSNVEEEIGVERKNSTIFFEKVKMGHRDQINTRSVSNATLGKLPKGGVGRIWAFPSAKIPSSTEVYRGEIQCDNHLCPSVFLAAYVSFPNLALILSCRKTVFVERTEFVVKADIWVT